MGVVPTPKAVPRGGGRDTDGRPPHLNPKAVPRAGALGRPHPEGRANGWWTSKADIVSYL